MSKFFVRVKWLALCAVLALPMLLSADCKSPRRGPPGPRGLQGPPGTTFEANFASRYLLVSGSNLEIGGGTNVPLNEEYVTETDGISFDTGTNEFVFNTSGLFRVSYGIILSGYLGTGEPSVSLTLDGLTVPGTNVVYPAAGVWIVQPTVIISVERDQRLALTNIAPGTIGMNTAQYNNASAFVTITQIR